MAGSFYVDVPNHCVFSRGWGELGDADLLGHVRALAAHPRFEPWFSQCVDYLEVERVEVSSRAVRQAALANPFLPDARRAFIVNRVVMAGLVRMYELSGALASGAIVIVDNFDEARRALGLDPSVTWPEAAPDWTSAHAC